MKQGLLTVKEISREELKQILALSAKLKHDRGRCDDYKPLAGKCIGMIFAKSSTRTLVSFAVGIQELGGFPLYLDQGKLQVGRGETLADTAKVLSRYLHGLVIRTNKHSDLEIIAAQADIPVINALTDEYHPCQALADLFTIYEYSGRLEGIKLVFVGDGKCNMANSLALSAKLAGLNMVIAAPPEYHPRTDLMETDIGPGTVSWEPDPLKAVAGADYIYTDVWVSMGFEQEAGERLKNLAPYQVNRRMVENAAPNVKIMHCLPARRDEEITSDIMDSEYSIVFDQAENRLHVQKAILSLMLSGK